MDGASVRLIIGEAFGHKSPVKSFVDTLYLECRLRAGSEFVLPASAPETAMYIVSGEVHFDGHDLAEGVMAVARAGAAIELEARSDCRLMVLGGAPVGNREIWWNFVAATQDRIDQAKEDWKAGRFSKIEGDEEFIPLPD